MTGHERNKKSFNDIFSARDNSRKPIKSGTGRHVVIVWSGDFSSQKMASLIRDKFDISVSYFTKDGDFAISMNRWDYTPKILNFIKRKVDIISVIEE